MNNKPPILIDNGSFECRAGLRHEEGPSLIFRNTIAKLRNKDKGKRELEIQVGNDIENLDNVRFALKSQFDQNVVVNFEVQETILEYLFRSLRLSPADTGVEEHPILMTEAYLNPNYCRSVLSELLFETFEVPGVGYGVDSLFAFNKNFPEAKDGLIVSFGYHTIEILPYLDGTVDPVNSRRINIGGSEVVTFLHRLLQLKYPSHVNTITLGKVEEILHTHGYISQDYAAELEKWTSPEFYNEHVLRLKPQHQKFPSLTGSTDLNSSSKERRREGSRRMVEMNARKREERLTEDEERLEILTDIKSLVEESEDPEEVERALSAAGVESLEELSQVISNLIRSIAKVKSRKGSAEDENEAGEPVPKQARGEIPCPTDKEEFEAWITDAQSKRSELLKKQALRRQRRSEMGKRKTVASHERMRLVAQLAKKEKHEKKDTFGMNDEDWDVYKAIQKDGGGSDSEDDAEKLNDLEQLLRRHDPTFEKETDEDDELHIGLEKTRGPELLFQPSMIGETQGGVHETLEVVLKLYPAEVQTRLVSNIFLTGGLTSLPGIFSRIEAQVLEMRPFESSFKVTVGSNPVLDPWLGMKAWAGNEENIVKYFLTKAEYEERGGEYFKAHSASNVYYPSPHV